MGPSSSPSLSIEKKAKREGRSRSRVEEALSLRRAPLTWRKGRRWGLKIPSFKRVPVQVRQWVKTQQRPVFPLERVPVREERGLLVKVES